MMNRTPLKRTGFKKKATVPLKRTRKPVAKRKPKKKVIPEARLRKQLWELCKQIIRKQYGNICYTCGKNDLTGSGWHTGHFIPSSTCGLYLRYNINNLRPQCYHCNINLGGNGSNYYREMVRNEGQEFVDILFEQKKLITKGGRIFYEDLISRYSQILQDLQEQ